MNPLRVAAVSFFNAKPLIYGLDAVDSIRLLLDVPSKLIELIRGGSADVALLPTIDLAAEDLLVVPAGAIGCEGPTLTVRIFSRVPLEQVTSLACDGDSHTSVALARILFAEHVKTSPEFVPMSTVTDDPQQARLLIGDKVICEEPPGFPIQHDLGELWKQMTGLPFVFAVWAARPGVELGDLPTRLEAAKRAGLERVDDLVRDFAIPRGWPADIARRYLVEFLKFDIGPRQIEAMRLFHQLAQKHGLTHRVPAL